MIHATTCSLLLQDLGKLTKKLSKDEVASLLAKLDTDGDGQLSFEEFKVLFEKADKRKKESEKKGGENLIRHHSAKVGALSCPVGRGLMSQQSLHQTNTSNLPICRIQFDIILNKLYLRLKRISASNPQMKRYFISICI